MPRSSKGRAIPVPTLWAFVARYMENLTLHPYNTGRYNTTDKAQFIIICVHYSILQSRSNHINKSIRLIYIVEVPHLNILYFVGDY